MAAALVALDGSSFCHQRFYAHKVVRDLLWAFCSPHMLAAAHFPVLPTRMFGADGGEVQHHPRVIAWLRALDADPSHLIAFLQGTTRSKGKMLALGVYFASLLEYWLRFCPLFRVERFALGKQIVSASGQTVGQLKFLLRLARRSDEDDASSSISSALGTLYQDLHVESSVKFFLLHPHEGADSAMTRHPVQLEQFVGPHLGENLAWRVQEVARKLAMCKGESVQRWLETHYSDAVTSHMVLRGYLFYPLSHFARTADVTQHHGWAFHTNPTTASRTTDSVLDSQGQDEPSHPSIAPDHLRGWWTSDLASELPAKVHANAAAGVGPSRFVVLPKLHWLSPVIAHEPTATASVDDTVIVDGDASLGIETLELLTLDALVAVAQEHFATVASTPVASSAVIMPLLIAELVRCRPDDVEYEAASDDPQRWKELSRGFALDPASWDPRPLCHDAVRFRRVATNSSSSGTNADASTAREYEGRREWVHGSVIVKPSDDELAKSLERKQHAFAQPHTVTPRALCDEMLTVVGANHKPAFTHADLKASIRDVLESQHEQSSAVQSLDSSNGAAAPVAFVLKCLQYLVLPASSSSPSSSQPPHDVKAAQRVGHLILDAFEAQASSSQSHRNDHVDKRGWQALFLRVVQDMEAWSYVSLALRAADVICRRSGTRWSNDRSTEDSAAHCAVETVVQDLLGCRTLRANAIAVETIKVFWLSGRSSQDAERTAALVRSVFDALVDQADWTSVEQLAVQSHDLALQQQLAQRFVRLNMSKALKRLHRAMAEQHVAQHPHDHAALQSLMRHRDSSIHVTYSGPMIDHEANRSLLIVHGPALLSWELVDTPEQLDAVLAHLAAQEQDIAACATGKGDPLDVMRRVVIGMDCEWRPQFLRSSAATGDDEENDEDDDDESSAPSSTREGLSVYQLAIGDRVFVVDVQALSEAAAAPLQFIWTRPATFALVGFCVTSDVKRLAVSFPDLFAANSDNGDEEADDDDSSGTSGKLLVELKQLALYRHVPASKWGLAQLARVCLDDDVDKEQQCSDWSARPLTQRQLAYAANDAFAVQQIALHLLADVPLRAPVDVLACLRQFAVVTDASAAPSFGHWVAAVPPLSLGDVRLALTELELTDVTSFHTIARDDGAWDDSIRTPHGIVVKTIAVVVRASSSSGLSTRTHTVLSRYAAVVVALDRSIDMAALGRVLGVAADDVVLADRQTLIRVFGYSRGCVGPLGLREQQDIQVVVDERLLAEDRLLCGAGVIDHVYAIAPAVLVDVAQAVVALISEQEVVSL